MKWTILIIIILLFIVCTPTKDPFEEARKEYNRYTLGFYEVNDSDSTFIYKVLRENDDGLNEIIVLDTLPNNMQSFIHKRYNDFLNDILEEPFRKYSNENN